MDREYTGLPKERLGNIRRTVRFESKRERAEVIAIVTFYQRQNNIVSSIIIISNNISDSYIKWPSIIH